VLGQANHASLAAERAAQVFGPLIGHANSIARNRGNRTLPTLKAIAFLFPIVAARPPRLAASFF
jgi:hypothetical protein